MKYAIISDIHGNLEALEAVLAEIVPRPIDRYICLGDIVGYGANPRECLERVRDLNPIVVTGNHDAAACERTDIRYFNQPARAAALWTRDQLSLPERNYLASLPLVEEVEGMAMVHSSLNEPEKWHYILSQFDARPTFNLLPGPACFIGHSHVPVAFEEKGGGVRVLPPEVMMEGGVRYIINVGSVGQPRDGDPRASFALWDTQAGRVEIIRVEYPIKPAQEKILRAGLPAILASRLSAGQ